MNDKSTAPNEFEQDKPGTNARSDAEAQIEELRARGGVFVEAVRATRMPMVLTDPNLPDNPIVFANQAFLKLSGYSMKEVLGQQPLFMNGKGTESNDTPRFAEMLRGDQDEILETIQYRKDGSRFVATILLSAFKDEQGRTVNHFMSWLDVTRRVDAENVAHELGKVQAALRESEERQAFQLRLSDALASLGSPADIHSKAMRLIAEHLHVDWCYFNEFDERGTHATVLSGFHRSDLPSMAGVHDLSAEREFLDLVHSGQELNMPDLQSSPYFTPGARAHYGALGIRSALGAPLISNGRLAAVLLAADTHVRTWTRGEAELLSGAAERTWTALQRARAEATSRESEERQRFLLSLGDAIRAQPSAQEKIEVAARLLGEKLGASRVLWAEYDWERNVALIFNGWFADDAQPFPAVMQLGDYEGEALNDLKAGRTVRVDDVGLKLDEPAYAAIADLGVKALLSPPLLLDGKLKMNLSIHQHEPRHWTDDEVALVRDVAERLWAEVVRARAETALRESEHRLRQFGEASQDVLWIRDAETLQWTYLTPAFETIYGLSREEALDGNNYRTWLEMIVPEDRDSADRSISTVRDGETVTFEYRIKRRSDGSIRWLRNTDFPMRDASGRVAQIGGVGSDITRRKHHEERQKILLAELQHRVRNTLGIVKSITRRTADASSSVADMAAHLSGRLDAFARVQSAVTRNPHSGIDLRGIIADELLAHAAHEGEQVRIDGPDVALRPKAAESISLALHELTTNAVKHGALVNPGGRISIGWTVSDDGTALEFTWSELAGNGELPKPSRHGFGMELLTRVLPYDLNARTKVEFHDRGLRFTMDLPLDNVVQ